MQIDLAVQVPGSFSIIGMVYNAIPWEVQIGCVWKNESVNDINILTLGEFGICYCQFLLVIMGSS